MGATPAPCEGGEARAAVALPVGAPKGVNMGVKTGLKVGDSEGPQHVR